MFANGMNSDHKSSLAPTSTFEIAPAIRSLDILWISARCFIIKELNRALQIFAYVDGLQIVCTNIVDAFHVITN